MVLNQRGSCSFHIVSLLVVSLARSLSFSFSFLWNRGNRQVYECRVKTPIGPKKGVHTESPKRDI